MSIVKKISDKLHLKQWGIGFIRQDIRTFILEQNTQPVIEWLDAPDPAISSADPFLLKTDAGEIRLLFERMTSYRMDGTIRQITLDNNLRPIREKELLAEGTHLSYPFIYKENGKTYIFPENALGGSLTRYEYDEQAEALINPQLVIDKPVLDSTIVHHQGKYWLFCTELGKDVHRNLLLFSADSLAGPYTPHPANPIKQDLYGSRPGGAIIEVEGQLYRPAQNCRNYYGESLVINKINVLNANEFREEPYMEIKPSARDFNYGIHHIHFIDNLIVVDGQRNHFQPIQQLLRKLSKSF